MTDFTKIFNLNHENEWFKPKHIAMYRDYAFRASQESHAIRRKAGAVILSPRGSLFIGYNGTPAGQNNCCEDDTFKTKENVIHAEDNAIRKMINEGINPTNSIIFITDSPCMGCVENVIIKHNIKAVFYFRHYRDIKPLQVLEGAGIMSQYVDENFIEELRIYQIEND